MRLLCGDIGGTNARLVTYDAPDDPIALRDSRTLSDHHIVVQKYYKNDDFSSFSEVLKTFLALPDNANTPAQSCCFAVAGPVSDNRINFTNRDGWVIDGDVIARDFKIAHVQLINDFVANGYGLLSLKSTDFVTLQKGITPTGPASQPVALLGAGTGLGECFLTPDNNGNLTTFPTEGGHVDFAPRSPAEVELLSFIQRQLASSSDNGDADAKPRVSVERVVSGMGLENIYEYLRDKCPENVDKTLDEKYNMSKERGGLIGAEKGNYPLFMQAMEMMFAIYGGEAGDVALKYLPFGGIFVAAGIAPKNIDLIKNSDSQFFKRFQEKGRMSALMKKFPLHVVMKEDIGIDGAHAVSARNAASLLAASRDGGVGVKEEEPSEELRGKVDSDAARSGSGTSSSLNASLRKGWNDCPVAVLAAVSTTTAIFTSAAVVGALVAARRWNVL